MSIYEEIISTFCALTEENQRKFLEELKKALQNRTEPSPNAGELPHSHYTIEN